MKESRKSSIMRLWTSKAGDLCKSPEKAGRSGQEGPKIELEGPWRVNSQANRPEAKTKGVGRADPR